MGCICKKIWEFPYVRAIQTGLELDDASTGLTSMERGTDPLAVPFAVVEKQIVEKLDMPGYRFDEIERSGILVTDTQTWFSEMEEEL